MIVTYKYKNVRSCETKIVGVNPITTLDASPIPSKQKYPRNSVHDVLITETETRIHKSTKAYTKSGRYEYAS